MPPAARPAAIPRAAPSRIVRAGLLTSVTDGLFACASSLAFGTPLARLWQGVASTVVGPAAFERGAATVALGLAMHVGVALGWSAVFYALHARSARLRALLAAPAGIARVAAGYGPAIWLVMSLVVIPLLVHRPPAITPRWWVQLIGHFPCVGLPIVWSIARPDARAVRATPVAA